MLRFSRIQHSSIRELFTHESDTESAKRQCSARAKLGHCVFIANLLFRNGKINERKILESWAVEVPIKVNNSVGQRHFAKALLSLLSERSHVDWTLRISFHWLGIARRFLGFPSHFGNGPVRNHLKASNQIQLKKCPQRIFLSKWIWSEMPRLNAATKIPAKVKAKAKLWVVTAVNQMASLKHGAHVAR